MLRLLELSIIYLHSEAFSTKTTVSEVKYSGSYTGRLYVCSAFCKVSFQRKQQYLVFELEHHVDYVSLRDMENPDRFGFILQPQKQKKSVPSFHIFE